MKNRNQKKALTLADTKRALHEMMVRDGLRFPETVDDVDRLEASVDEARIPTPDVNQFLRFLREDKPVVPFPQSAHASAANSFGHFLALMRRKHGYTIDGLARAADLDATELRTIESDANYEAELSTIHGLAKHFGLPVKALMKIAQLAADRQPISPELQLRYAASASLTAPLTADEETVLQAYLKSVLERTDRR
ncbi:MAG: hypothetical protein WC378_05885 [Opitutaceae bacterium]|jgi:DNA-binding XRE family transcriptional regulator